MAPRSFNLPLCLRVDERRMAQGWIQQELNVLYTCSLSPSVSEKGTDRTVNAGLDCVCVCEGLQDGLNVNLWLSVTTIQTKACSHILIHLI